MPDYGVDTPEWEPLPWSWAAERLNGNRNFWVVTVSADGRPHALPVWGVWDDGDGRFCFSCAPRSRKGRNLKANPRVVVAIDDTLECVSIEGEAELVTDDAALDVWIERYVAKYKPMAPNISGEFMKDNLLFEVTPERAFGIIEREEEFGTRATRWTFAA